MLKLHLCCKFIQFLSPFPKQKLKYISPRVKIVLSCWSFLSNQIQTVCPALAVKPKVVCRLLAMNWWKMDFRLIMPTKNSRVSCSDVGHFLAVKPKVMCRYSAMNWWKIDWWKIDLRLIRTKKSMGIALSCWIVEKKAKLKKNKVYMLWYW